MALLQVESPAPKKLVLEAIDEKRLVVVALVVVEFDASKFTK